MKSKREAGGEEAVDIADVQRDIALHQREFWAFFGRMKARAQKMLIWGVFFLILWLLRDFFTLIFLTFFFSFVSATIARYLGSVFPALGWRTRVVTIFTGFLAVLSLLVWLAIPQVKRGAWQLKETIQDLPTKWESEIDPWLYENSALYRRLVLEPIVESDDEVGPESESAEHAEPSIAAAPEKAPRRRLWEVEKVRSFLEETQADFLARFPNLVTDVVTATTAVFSLLFLSFLFSFLIVFDLDVLKREVRKLENTKLTNFYQETVEDIVKFGSVLGKVLEAQAVIALVNTILTAIGLWALDIPNIGFLSVFVFVCGFIPVAGVFISSVPICLVGLVTHGVGMLAILILFITGIHMLEAYVLNPRIMGAALHVNPVLVLIILVIGHHALGVWGLLLGLPICYYFFTHVIKREEPAIGFAAKRRRSRGREKSRAP